ncbi:Dephospho-CoA kinase [Stenotrophomonas lactitubi]|nr:Dephospho-CoA kinase [Stenotrophomonas lactitubi]CAH0222829.1 Dephospho-CoA kinase [Stenotrophomonas lactitubi]CAH0237730.1 Dephospho-CoA kinase [Stenotrophomonas lactitubi]CAH0257110.1 Dephospho-CoA kinase [Stenotrophomonas lactitubi]
MAGMPDITLDPAEITTFAEGDPDENPWVLGAPQPEVLRVMPWSPLWANQFEHQRAQLQATLGNSALCIEHVGSTAVPGLPAKPILDIDLLVADPADEAAYLPRLQTLGYVLTVRERSWYQHRMLRLDTPRVNLHVFAPDCAEHIRHRLFRDWLRSHEDDRLRYAQAKRAALQGSGNVQAYNRSKQEVVRSIHARLFAARGW